MVVKYRTKRINDLEKIITRIRCSLILVNLSPYTKNKLEEAINSIDSAISSQAPKEIVLSENVYNLLFNMDDVIENIFKKVVEIT